MRPLARGSNSFKYKVKYFLMERKALVVWIEEKIKFGFVELKREELNETFDAEIR